MNSQVSGSLESGKIALGETRAQSAGEQNAGFAENVGKFIHEHSYMTAAAGAVAAVGVLALTKGKMAATSADLLAPVVRNVSSESALLREAGAVLSTQKGSLAVLGKSALPEAGQVVTKPTLLSYITAESSATRVAIKSMDSGAALENVRSIGFTPATDAGIRPAIGSVRPLASAEKSKLEVAARSIAVDIGTGERVAFDISNAGPMEFARVDLTRVLARRPNEFYKQEYLLGGGDPAKYDSFGYFISRPEVQQAGSFHTKFPPSMFSKDLSPFALRVSGDVKAPAALLSREGFVSHLLIPPGASNAQVSEAMVSALSAERVLSWPAAQEASLIVKKSAPGFLPRMTEAPAESMQDMMRHAIQGSSDWIRGARGNSYTRFLRDLEGDFTKGDRTMLHKLFTGERVRWKDIAMGERVSRSMF